ncbi:UNVERIFIED_CONTAM: hypothetical protein Slati_1790100 [Sesamum latifolium]|uniref:Retrotransposon Copia-like N-terminal domain-containing protein n=1 Tax=Sesamum latifolium TaxID=2727402 RepID=A0AAW2WXI1_9LAMI
MGSPSKTDKQQKKTLVDQESLKVQATDNLGSSLVSNLLDGMNFLSWSRSVKIALGAKMKFGFINGKNSKHSESAEEFEQWTRADCLVVSWLLNSMSKDILELFSILVQRENFGWN